MATFAVTDNADSGAGSLRDAINQANLSADPNNAITFSGNVGTIQLLSDLPLVATSVQIDAKGSTLDGSVTTNGNIVPTYRGFLISGIAANGTSAAATTVGISNLTIQNVVAQGGNGADGGAGGLGAGGAIFVGPMATVTLTNVDVSNASAVGGTGGGGGRRVSGNGRRRRSRWRRRRIEWRRRRGRRRWRRPAVCRRRQYRLHIRRWGRGRHYVCGRNGDRSRWRRWR